MLGIPIGLISANAVEWAFHKYIQHGIGSKEGSYWAFHWREHHPVVRKNGYYDPGYKRPFFAWHAQSKEKLALAGAAVAVAPLFPVAPFLTGTWWYCIWNYYGKHKKSHLDPDWARVNLPWHYDHHMAPNQHANFCVTRPWFDEIMGTRVPFIGTDIEVRLHQKQFDRQQAKAKAAVRAA